MTTTVTRYAPHAADAVPRALAQVGTSYPAGWCLRWAASIFGVPGVGDWDGDSANDAEDFWKAAVARGTVIKTADPEKIPAGSMVMWTGGSHDHGHAAVAIGGGRMVSTDLPRRARIGNVEIDTVRTSWGLTLVGAILVDGNGYGLIKPAGASTLKKYRVTAESGLRGRTGPSTSHPTVMVAPEGKILTVKQLVQNGREQWAVSRQKNQDLYFSLAYLERV